MIRRKIIPLSNKRLSTRNNHDIVRQQQQQQQQRQQQLQYIPKTHRWNISINDIVQDSDCWRHICNYSRFKKLYYFVTNCGMTNHQTPYNTVLIRVCNILDSVLRTIEVNFHQLIVLFNDFRNENRIIGCSSSGHNIIDPSRTIDPSQETGSDRRKPKRKSAFGGTWLFPFLLLVCYITVIECKKNDVTPCKLPCKNAGVCVKGKDHVLPVYGEDTSLVSVQDQTIQTDYCTCPLGYTGAYCEIKYVMCPDNETKMCNNGAPCQYATTDYGDAYYHCECDISGTDLSTAYARELCQKVSTVFCSITAQKEKDQYRKSLGITGSSFCMNGGKCVEPLQQLKGRHHAGCICPTGWIGNHCEKPDPKINPQYAEKPKNPDPLFLRQHLQNVQDELTKNAAKLKLHKSNNKARSFISYMLSFIITFLLIFTGIGLVFWIYMNYCQHRSISISANSHNVLSSVMILGNSSGRGSKSSRRSGGSNGGRSKTSSGSNGGRKKKLSAAERARIPQRTTSSNSFFLSQQQPQQQQPQLQQYDYSLDGGYSSSGASSHQRRRRNNNNSNSRSRPQQKQQQYRDDPIPVSEIELS